MTVPPPWGPLRLSPWLRRLCGRNPDRIGDGSLRGDRSGERGEPGAGRTAGIVIMVATGAIMAAAIAIRGPTIGTNTPVKTAEPAITSVSAPMPDLPACDGCSPLPGLLSADTVPDTPATPAPASDPAVQASMPGCAEWTDRCVTCQRDAGQVICSNIGIACQPQAVVCLRPAPSEEKPAQPTGK
jgi:hypothetical protein